MPDTKVSITPTEFTDTKARVALPFSVPIPNDWNGWNVFMSPGLPRTRLVKFTNLFVCIYLSKYESCDVLMKFNVVGGEYP